MVRASRRAESAVLQDRLPGPFPELIREGAGDGEGAKTVEPRSEEAETTEIGTQRGGVPRACPRADGPRTLTGWWTRPGRRTEWTEISDVVGSQSAVADEDAVTRDRGAIRRGTGGRGHQNHAPARASAGQGGRRARCGAARGAAPAPSRCGSAAARQ